MFISHIVVRRCYHTCDECEPYDRLFQYYVLHIAKRLIFYFDCKIQVYICYWFDQVNSVFRKKHGELYTYLHFLQNVAPINVKPVLLNKHCSSNPKVCKTNMYIPRWWCEKNHLAINISKTKLMYVTSKLTHRQLTNTHNLLSVPFVDYIVDESSR